MITDELLQEFCSDDTTRSALCKPFNVGEYTYACDGHMAVRVPLREQHGNHEGVAGVVDVGWVEPEGIAADKWMAVPATGPIETRRCGDCSGTGKYDICPDCDGDGEVSWTSDQGYDYEAECKMCRGKGHVSGKESHCETCDGTGTIKKYKNVTLGTKFLSAALLEIVAKLPGVQIAPDAVESMRPIPFKFDGGIGIIMPLFRLEG